jgi:hypothetical protein
MQFCYEYVPNIADFAKLCHLTNIVQPLGKSDIKICQIGNAAEEEDFFSLWS